MKKIMIFICMFISCLCLFQPATVYANEKAKEYGLKKIDEDDEDEVKEALEGIIIKIDDDYYYGATNIFYYLKDEYGDRNFKGNPEFKDMDWNEIDTSLDSLDAINFVKKTKIYGGTTMWAIETFIYNVLKMDQMELSKVLPLVEHVKPITFVHASSYLVSVGYALSNGFLDMFMQNKNTSLATAAYTASELRSIAMSCDGTSIIDSLAIIPDILTGYLADFFTMVIVMLMSVGCYARKLEIAARSIFMPIGLADISGRGVQGPGMRYLKTLFACALHAGGIVALIQFATVFQVADIPFAGLAIPIALLGSIGLVKKVAQEAFA